MHFISKIEKRERERVGILQHNGQRQRYIEFGSFSTMERDNESETLAATVIQLLLLLTPLVTL